MNAWRSGIYSPELAGEAEAEGLLAADPHRRQRVGLIRESGPVSRIVICQRGAFFIAQEVQVARHGATRHLELLHEVTAVGQVPGRLPRAPSAPCAGYGSNAQHRTTKCARVEEAVLLLAFLRLDLNEVVEILAENCHSALDRRGR